MIGFTEYSPVSLSTHIIIMCPERSVGFYISNIRNISFEEFWSQVIIECCTVLKYINKDKLRELAYTLFIDALRYEVHT